MAAFNADIFTYTTSVNPTTFATEGSLSAVSGATALVCPQGRFLYENGRKLYPDANPGITTYMVGVFDPVSFLSGFIDPNSEKFTLMNTDKPVDQANSSNVFGTNPNGSTSDIAQPVFTRGNIIALGTVTVGSTALIGSTTTIANGDLNVLNGKLNLDISSPNPIVGTVTLGSGTATVSTSAVTAGSRIFLTYTTFSNPGILRVGTITAGTSFIINSNNLSDGSAVNWLIIN